MSTSFLAGDYLRASTNIPENDPAVALELQLAQSWSYRHASGPVLAALGLGFRAWAYQKRCPWLT